MSDGDALSEELRSLLERSGLKLVEFSVSRHRGSVTGRATIYAAGGTGTEECARAHRIIYPRLQALYGPQAGLEVMSPGIDRILKSTAEWRIFEGRWVRVMARTVIGEAGTWIQGRIEHATDEGVVLATDMGRRALRFDEIAKARLDSTREGD
jgi:ribosome maturation factor RimP